MTEIIFYGTPNRASTLQRRVRSTKAYALLVQQNALARRESVINITSSWSRIRSDSMRHSREPIATPTEAVTVLMTSSLYRFYV